MNTIIKNRILAILGYAFLFIAASLFVVGIYFSIFEKEYTASIACGLHAIISIIFSIITASGID